MTIQGQAFAGTTALGLPDEIAFLARHGVAPDRLKRASAIAEAFGVTADRALLSHGLLDERSFYRALAAELDLPFADSVTADATARFPEGVRTGLAPLAPNTAARFALAPDGAGIARLLARLGAPDADVAIATPSSLRAGIMTARARAIARRAANALPDAEPHLSYRDFISFPQIAALAVLAGPLAFVATLAFEPLWVSLMTIAGLAFLAMTAMRLSTVLQRIPVEPERPPRRRRGRDLPTYTVVVPLYREWRVLPRLLAALSALDYPSSKLQVMLVVEAGDSETRAALSRTDLPGFIEVIVAPPGRPRTKPRALNIALELARGAFTVVYDAEDVPHPGQLRLAVATFAALGPDVACCQARLAIDNTEDSWLTRFFTVEYAALFDVINPGLAAMDLPIPLGGTSNHFRTDVLRTVGAWDAWNVTEDADLGIRLALAGFRVADLPSTTIEEAPAQLKAWMSQRARWMKGFMQVCITHSRRPWAAGRTLGPLKALAAVTMTFGTVATALGYPVFTVLAVWSLLSGSLWQSETLPRIFASAVGFVVLPAGLAAMVAPPIVALRRRGWTKLLPLVALLPFYYVLVSAAAWRGFVELLTAPFHWNKTDHGLAVTSRSGALRVDGATPRPPPGPAERC